MASLLHHSPPRHRTSTFSICRKAFKRRWRQPQQATHSINCHDRPGNNETTASIAAMLQSKMRREKKGKPQMISNATILWIAAPGKKDVQSMRQHAHISMAVSGMLSSSTRPSSTELRQLRTLEASARAPHTTNHPIPIPAMLSTAAYSYSNLLLLPPSQRDIPPTKPQSKPPYRVISDRWETVRLIREARPPAGIKEANKWAVSAHRFTLPNAFAL